MNIQVKNISYHYGDQKVLADLTLTITDGTIAALIGPSGTGKSTLLAIIAGLLEPASGTLLFNEETCANRRPLSAFMQQKSHLLPWLSVRDNILLPTQLGKPTEKREQLADELIHTVGLTGFAHHTPDRLSAGMQKRASLAQALILKRPILLLDEPFSSLDLILREEIYHLLRRIRDSFGTTIILTTHDFHDATTLADITHALSDGRIQNSWPTDPHNLHTLHDEMRSALSRNIEKARHSSQSISALHANCG